MPFDPRSAAADELVRQWAELQQSQPFHWVAAVELAGRDVEFLLAPTFDGLSARLISERPEFSWDQVTIAFLDGQDLADQDFGDGDEPPPQVSS